MLLRELNIIGRVGLKNILIENDKIASIDGSANRPLATQDGISIPFNEAIAFPGLINSHDHLDFNLFPQLGNRIYRNYTEWGPDIQIRNKAIIEEILTIPQALRTKWGIYKNLLNGVTTVVNHGNRLFIEEDPELIRVIQEGYPLHSVAFEKNWKWKINRPFTRNRPFVIHVGEGTDKAAELEIDQLTGWNFFRKPLIGIHGVAMTEKQAERFCALIWCPASNYFLLGQTARIDLLMKKLPILFGTDSTLTAGWNIWEQIRLARTEARITDLELINTLTLTPAMIWGLTDRGEIQAGRKADIVIARRKQGLQGMRAFYEINPEDILLVLSDGKIKLFDPSLLNILEDGGLNMEDFKQSGRGKYTLGDLPALLRTIRRYCPNASFPSMLD